MGITERIKLWLTGHKRISSAKRGRIYAKEDTSVPGSHNARALPKASLSMKITRANGDVEYISAPVTVERKKD